jgi:hypothetical protein
VTREESNEAVSEGKANRLDVPKEYQNGGLAKLAALLLLKSPPLGEDEDHPLQKPHLTLTVCLKGY